MLRNVGLTEQLMARLAELAASRERLVTAQDRERRRLERDCVTARSGSWPGWPASSAHGGTGTRSRRGAGESAAEPGDLADRRGAESLRELARGIYPALLADMGIAAALDAQARKAPIPVSVEADGIGRYPQEIEAAVYFCALEALRNAARHARRLPRQRSPVRKRRRPPVRSHRRRPGIRTPATARPGADLQGDGRPDRRPRRRDPHRFGSRPGHQDQRQVPAIAIT